MKFSKRINMLFLFLALVFIFTACGGGGGGGGVILGGANNHGSALVVTSNVSVVSAQTSTDASPVKPQLKGLLIGVIPSNLAATTDYNTDKPNVYVQERTSDAFKTINQILCMMGQTKYDVMLNKGVYTALVDQNLCSTNNADPAAAGQQAQNQSSGANMPAYMTFTVDASRADDNSPQYVRVWVHQPASDNDQAALIYGKAVISEGTSTTNPYGIFTMDFAGHPIVNGVPAAQASFKGTLEAVRSAPSGTVLLKFVSHDVHPDCGGVQDSTQKVTLDRLPDGTAGAGLIDEVSSGTCGTQNESFAFAYNDADFWRQDVNTLSTACLSRTKFDQSAWSYGLYNMAGARVTRNSGFPITFTAIEDGNTYQGYVGYWGVWVNNNNNNAITLHNNQTVASHDYRNNTSTDYTIFKAGGKLKKHTRNLLTLADIKNTPLNYWEQPMSGGTGTQYQVVWDDTNQVFAKVAEMPQNCNNNCTWAQITSNPTPTIDVSHLPQGNLNFWSDSLGGQAYVTLGGCLYTAPSGTVPGYTSCTLPDSSTQVVFYKEDLVYPGDSTVPGNLACYDQCLKSSASGINPADPYYSNMMSGQTTTTSYTFDATNLVLMDGIHSVVSTTTGTYQQYQWGFMSGALIDPTPANVSLLACPWNSSQVCGWQAWNVLPTFYTWETGPNDWNRFVGLKSGSNFVNFDAPLQITYVHTQADNTQPDFAFNGVTFMLQYGGFGQLNGIPSYCVDMDSGSIVDCSQSNGSNSIRWVPQFTIPALQADGSLTEVTDSDSNTYYVKPLEIEQRMLQDADPNACDTLALTGFGGYTLPDMTMFTDPTTAEPAAPGAPAVIGGVVQ